MFQGPHSDQGDEFVLNFIENIGGSLMNSAPCQFRLGNHGDQPAISEGVRLRLKIRDDSFEETYPMARGDGIDAFMPMSGGDPLSGQIVIEPDSRGHYSAFLSVDVERFPPAWCSAMDSQGMAQQVPPSEALAGLADAGYEQVTIELHFLYRSPGGEKFYTPIAEVDADLDLSTDFAKHLMVPEQYIKMEAYEDAIEEMVDGLDPSDLG